MKDFNNFVLLTFGDLLDKARNGGFHECCLECFKTIPDEEFEIFALEKDKVVSMAYVIGRCHLCGCASLSIMLKRADAMDTVVTE